MQIHWFTLLLTVLIAAKVLGREPLVHVSLAKENRIVTFRLNEEDGTLTPVDSVKLNGGPGALAYHPTLPILFASIRSLGNLASFHVDESSGKLTPINEIHAGADPAYLSVDKSGKLLMSAYYREGKIIVHSIKQHGAIGKELQSISTDERTHSIVPDRTGRYWFASHTRPNAIFQFMLDDGAMRLAENKKPKLLRKPNTGPRHLWFHPNIDFAYGSDEQGSSVSTYALDSESGRLNLRQTLSTLPETGTQTLANSTSDIEVHPSGRFVYVANRGHDTIARYAVHTHDGMLKRLGNTPTEPTTRSFNIDSSGRFLIAAGQTSGNLAVFQINPNSGDLERLNTLFVGKAPWWVLIR
ncbi:MAG: hypothetical protein CMM01_12300 [Rhodopirellula sp.]|nr:hypothetical protein [Rhodopirellula sp.]OUX50992.1 MAG: hypothetical protein CBE43_05040 [Rhodopirellula sp. TMED283]